MITAQISGYLVRNPEIEMISDNLKLCELTVASKRLLTDVPDILRIKVCGELAEMCEKYLKKGSGIIAAGNLCINLPRDAESETESCYQRINVFLSCLQLEFTDSKPNNIEDVQ